MWKGVKNHNYIFATIKLGQFTIYMICVFNIYVASTAFECIGYKIANFQFEPFRPASLYWR